MTSALSATEIIFDNVGNILESDSDRIQDIKSAHEDNEGPL